MTVSPCAVTTPFWSPSSSRTSWSCAARLTPAHKVANWSLATNFSTRSWVKPSTPFVIGPARAGSASATRGDTLGRAASESRSSAVTSSMLM